MLKKIVFCFSLISFMAYSSERAAASAGVEAGVLALPDISPKAFGVSGDEHYLIALRDFAQALLMQHRWLGTIIVASEMGEGLNEFELDDKALVKNALDRIAWLEQLPEIGTDKTLQEIKQAIKTHTDHELLFWSGGGYPIFAVTSEGIELLLKHRSLIVNDIVALEDGPLIDNIYQKAMQQEENKEVQLLARILKFKLKQSQLNAALKEQSLQRDVTESDVEITFLLIKLNEQLEHYQLSQELQDSLQRTLKLVHDFKNFLASPDGKIPGNPTKFKLRAIEQYNKTQPAIYEDVRKELEKRTLQLARTNRAAFVYLKTAQDRQGECLISKAMQGFFMPKQLESLDRSNRPEGHQGVCAVQPPAAPLLQAKREVVKKQKKAAKQYAKKGKQHKVSHRDAISQACSEQAEEQDMLSVTAASSTQPIQVATPIPQEKQPKDNPGTSLCAEQKPKSLAALAEIPVEAAPAPSTLTACECKGLKGVATNVTGVSRTQPEMPFVIEISRYSDGKVLSDVEGAPVVIEDPCNKMCLHLYRTDKKCMRYNYTPVYKQHILRWFQSAKEALSKKDVSTVPEQNNALRIHRFSRLVDQFIPTMGVTRTVRSRKRNHGPEREFVIPGYVEFYESRKPMYCLFSYIVDSANDKCFHRNMELRGVLKAFSDFYKNGFFEVERPPLECQKH